MQVLYKTITADTQVATTECYLVGAELSNGSNTSMIVYDEPDSTATAGKKVSTPQVTSYNRQASIVFPMPGVKCDGIYVDWNAGVGTIYYYY